VLINPVKIMPLVQIMGIHTGANVTMDGLETTVNFTIEVLSITGLTDPPRGTTTSI
jgi:hypothetical protein